MLAHFNYTHIGIVSISETCPVLVGMVLPSFDHGLTNQWTRYDLVYSKQCIVGYLAISMVLPQLNMDCKSLKKFTLFLEGQKIESNSIILSLINGFQHILMREKSSNRFEFVWHDDITWHTYLISSLHHLLCTWSMFL